MYYPGGYQKGRRISLFQGREERHAEPESCKARKIGNGEHQARAFRNAWEPFNPDEDGHDEGREVPGEEQWNEGQYNE